MDHTVEDTTDGNVFVISFSVEGIEAIVNLTYIDSQYIMAKMTDSDLPRNVDSILHMMSLRAQFNQQRKMEVWLVKLDESWTEEYLIELGREDPQAIADLGRMGENIYGKSRTSTRNVIV
jgi:hypothetical protein